MRLEAWEAVAFLSSPRSVVAILIAFSVAEHRSEKRLLQDVVVGAIILSCQAHESPSEEPR